MALDLIQQPGTITLARNPCVYKLQTDYTLAKGVRSTLTAADLSDRFQTDDTLTIHYTEPDGTEETITFTAKAVYDDEGEIPDDSFAGTNTAYWAAVRAQINAHSRIAPFFTAFYTDSPGIQITIQARSTETGWDIETTTTSAFTVADFAASASTLPSNYRALLEVFVERTYRAGDFAQAARLHSVLHDREGYMWFDVAGILASECRASRAEPVVPVWGTVAPALSDTLRRYYVRITEEGGEPPVADDWYYPGGTRLAMDGGVSQSIFAEGDFLGALDETDSLLTWMPDGRRMGVEQPEYLAWYNHTGATKETFLEMQWADIADNAWSASVLFHDGSPLDVRDQEVALYPVSPERMGLDAEASAYRYRVRVVEAGISGTLELSQWRTYYIDRGYYESQRYVQYLNGFGGPECVRCTGDWTKALRTERKTATQPLAPGYNAFASDRHQYAQAWSNEFVYRTGYISRGEAEALQEMLVAGQVYDVSAEGYIPLLLGAGSFRVAETRENLNAYEFRAQPRLEMVNYSKKKLTALLSGAWLDTNGEAWFDAFLVPWTEP